MNIYTHPKRIRILHNNRIKADRKTNYVSFGVTDMEWLVDACIQAGRDTLVIKETPKILRKSGE